MNNQHKDRQHRPIKIKCRGVCGGWRNLKTKIIQMTCDKVRRCAKTASGVRHTNGDRKRKKRTIPSRTIPLYNSFMFILTQFKYINHNIIYISIAKPNTFFFFI